MKKWDVFISHASEDKEEVARPLMVYLENNGIKVWLDEIELTLGDSLMEKIDEGLLNSSFGIVIFSKTFFSKQWPIRELNALFSLEENGQKKILPVRHNLSQNEFLKLSPLLSDRLAVNTEIGINRVGEAVLKVISQYSIIHQTQAELFGKLQEYKERPSIFPLIYCIYKEQLTAANSIFPIGNDTDFMGYFQFGSDYSRINKESVLVKYGIGGGFMQGIQRLLTDKILVGTIEDFEINSKFKNLLEQFLLKNEELINKMIAILQEENTTSQFYRDKIPVVVHKLADDICY